MNWAEHHTESEKLAATAQEALRQSDPERAENLYIASGKAEQAAFEALERSKERTRGITAVSTVALFYKGKDYASAQGFAYRCLASEGLPTFAITQIQNLLQTVWAESAIVNERVSVA